VSYGRQEFSRSWASAKESAIMKERKALQNEDLLSHSISSSVASESMSAFMMECLLLGLVRFLLKLIFGFKGYSSVLKIWILNGTVCLRWIM
jgi:hypothetical protein